jgi:hypothetical protein
MNEVYKVTGAAVTAKLKSTIKEEHHHGQQQDEHCGNTWGRNWHGSDPRRASRFECCGG